MLRQRWTRQAVLKADCWVYVLPWFHPQGIMRLEEDMQSWRGLLGGAEGFVVLARCAERGIEDEDDHSTMGSVEETEEAEEDKLPSIAMRVAPKRDAIQRSHWCTGGGGVGDGGVEGSAGASSVDAYCSISPALSCTHGLLGCQLRVFGVGDEEFDVAEDGDMAWVVEDLCQMIAGPLLFTSLVEQHSQSADRANEITSVGTRSTTGDDDERVKTCFLSKLPKSHWCVGRARVLALM